jgi:hypothetical protein
MLSLKGARSLPRLPRASTRRFLRIKERNLRAELN